MKTETLLMISAYSREGKWHEGDTEVVFLHNVTRMAQVDDHDSIVAVYFTNGQHACYSLGGDKVEDWFAGLFGRQETDR